MKDYRHVDVKPQIGRIVTVQQKTKETQKNVQEARDSVARAQASAKTATTKLAALEKQVANDKVALELAQSAQADVDTLTKELSTTQDALKSAGEKLTWTWNELQTTKGELEKKQKDIDKNQKLVDKAVVTEQKYHKLKWGLVIPLAAALMGLLIWKFKAVLLPLGYLGIGLMVGVPTLVLTFLAFKL